MLAITYQTYGPPEVLQITEEPDPIPRENEVLIRIEATAITKGECELRSPEIFSTVWFFVRLYFGLRTPRFGKLGSYFAGEVAGIGTEVTEFKTGDRVCGMSGPSFGAYAQLITVPEKHVLAVVPEGISLSEAAPLALGIDSLHFIRKLKISPNDRVLINGAGGGIGAYAVQLAKNLGAHVTAVDSDDKLDMLRQIGADSVIDYQKEKLSGHYDKIFDVVGTIKFYRSLKLLAARGWYVSAIPEFDRMILNLLNKPFSRKKVMTGLTSPTVEDLESLLSMMRQDQLRTIIHREFPLKGIVEAHRYIEDGKKIGNAILLPQRTD